MQMQRVPTFTQRMTGWCRVTGVERRRVPKVPLAATESSPCTSKLSGLQRTAAAGCFHAMLRMSALLLAVGLAALIIAGIITGALWVVHHGNAGQLLTHA